MKLPVERLFFPIFKSTKMFDDGIVNVVNLLLYTVINFRLVALPKFKDVI